MRLMLVTPPDAEPLQLAPVKLFLKQDFSDDDALITDLIRTSRQWCEDFTRRAMLAQTWVLALDQFPVATRLNPKADIILPKGRCLAVEWVKYRDAAGVEQTLTGPTSSPAGTGFQEDLMDDCGGRLRPAQGAAWPTTADVVNAVRIQFRCGYAQPEQIPGQLVDAIRYRIASLYEGRGEQDTQKWQGVAEAFAQPYALEWFG
jgi:uncharacterized phiE125 gp8 family phage protein